MSRHWSLIRLYGAAGPAETILDLIREERLDMKVMLGVWIEPETALDDSGTAAVESPTARAANTGMKWNPERTTLTDWGTEPTVIEPVTGSITLKGIDPAQKIEIIALDSGAKALGGPVQAEKTEAGYRISVGEPVTPWYLVRVVR